MEDKQKYMAIVSEIVAKQSVILGPDIAMLKARSIAGLKIGDDGKVLDVEGDGKVILQQLVNSYVELSGLIVKNALGSIFEKYPEINKVD